MNEFTQLKNKKIKLFSSSKHYFSIIVLENEEIYLIGSFVFETNYFFSPRLINNKGILNGKKIKQISTGNDNVLILCEDNTLASFGNNNVGQLGDFSNKSYTLDPVLVNKKYIEFKNIIQISTGLQFSIILSDSGEVFSFGINTCGKNFFFSIFLFKQKLKKI
jgi:alpha-tubulin suppressor-like RCC1 family protein